MSSAQVLRTTNYQKRLFTHIIPGLSSTIPIYDSGLKPCMPRRARFHTSHHLEVTRLGRLINYIPSHPQEGVSPHRVLPSVIIGPDRAVEAVIGVRRPPRGTVARSAQWLRELGLEFRCLNEFRMASVRRQQPFDYQKMKWPSDCYLRLKVDVVRRVEQAAPEPVDILPGRVGGPL